MKKRAFSLVLMFFFCLTLLPTAAFAADDADDTGGVVIDHIIAVGNGSEEDSNWLNGKVWDPAARENLMTKDAAGVYSISYTNVAASDSYIVKFIANDNWDYQFGAPSDPAPLSGDVYFQIYDNACNIGFSVDEDNSTVTLVLDLSQFNSVTGKGATYSITITPPGSSTTDPAHFHPICGDDTCAVHPAQAFDHKLTSTSGVLYLDGAAQNRAETNGQAYYLLSSGTYYLADDLKLDGELRFAEDAQAELCLNGHSIISQADTQYGAISLFDNSDFTLTDCQQAGAITHDTAYIGRGVYSAGHSFKMYGGKITGNRLSSSGSTLETSGAGILVNNDDTTIFNGEISGNTCESAVGATGIHCENASAVYIGSNAAITDVIALTTISSLSQYSKIVVVDPLDQSLPAIPFRADPDQYKDGRALVVAGVDGIALQPEQFIWKYGTSDQEINKKLELDSAGNLIAATEKKQPVDATGEPGGYYPSAYFTCPSGITLDEISQHLKMYDPDDLSKPLQGTWTFPYDNDSDGITAQNVNTYGYLAEFEPEDKTHYEKSKLFTFYVTISDTSKITIDFSNETLKGFDTDGTYTINTVNIDNISKINLNASMGDTLAIAKQTIDSDKWDTSSKAVYISIQKLEIPARPAAPTGLAAVKTSSSGSTGQITGVTDKMQYRNASSAAWQDCTNTSITGLAKGQYEVRLKATDTAFASESVLLDIEEAPSSSGSSGSSSSSSVTYPVTVPTKTDNGTVTVSPKNAKKGSTVTITVTPDSGYQANKPIVTDKNGKALTVTKKSDTQYTFTMPDGKVTVTPTFTKINDEKPSYAGYDDVHSSDWYNSSVQYVTEKGLMSGTGSNKFSPNAPTTRGMLMTVLARYAGQDTTGSTPWYQAGMDWAKANGVSDGTNPTANITREQLVTMLYRYADSPSATGSLNDFSDAVNVSSYAVTAMQWAVASSIVNGSNGKLNPKSNATRAEVAAILARFCENVK